MAVQQHVLNWLYSVLTSEYQDVNRTYNDVAQALAQFPTLSPRTDVHTFPNGASALLLHLSGTLPAVFRGATYRYPVSVWVPHAYPHEAPLVYVTPTENMMVRPGQHVDPQGQVYHPYLVGWSEFWDKSTLIDFLAILRNVFAKEPPVIARQVARSPSTVPVATPTPPPIPPLPQELLARSRPSSVVQSAATPPPPPPKNAATTPVPPPAAAAAAPTTTSPPPPIPPHPHAGNRQSIAGILYDSRFGQTASATADPPAASPAPPTSLPPVPGRPAYQQPAQPQPQPLPYTPPYRPDITQQPPLQPPLPPQQQPAYYQYPPQQQQQPQQPQQPPQAYHQQPPWTQPPPSLPPQQPQPRAKAPPPPDIMDDVDGDPGNASSSADALATPPPPVPPNPEKDALLRELARTLAVARQRSRTQDTATLAGLQAQRTAMLAAAQHMQQEMSDIAQLSALLTANTDMLHESLAAADAVIARSRQTRPPAIDELLVGPTVVAAQLYDLVAEERALADAVFMLGRAVEHGRISPPVFAKMTRQLAREWYLKKALVRKIATGMGLITD